MLNLSPLAMRAWSQVFLEVLCGQVSPKGDMVDGLYELKASSTQFAFNYLANDPEELPIFWYNVSIAKYSCIILGLIPLLFMCLGLGYF